MTSTTSTKATTKAIAGWVQVAAEVCGRELSDVAVAAMARRLAPYGSEAVRAGLDRCAREVRGALSLAAIIERIPGAHPGPDEAWAIASRAYDEAASVVWTGPMAQAFGTVREMRDRVAARMAFREAYSRLVAEEPPGLPRWELSSGHDVLGRAPVVREAIAAGRLGTGDAQALGVLPTPVTEEAFDALPAPDAEVYDRLAGTPEEVITEARAFLARLRVGKPMPEAAE